jgi:hypothetical protein
MALRVLQEGSQPSNQQPEALVPSACLPLQTCIGFGLGWAASSMCVHALLLGFGFVLVCKPGCGGGRGRAWFLCSGCACIHLQVWRELL